MNVFFITLLVLSLASSVAALITLYRYQRKLKDFLSTGKKVNLELELREHQARQHELKNLAESIRSSQAQIESLQKKSLQKYSLIRFNPFRDTGGDQSFCLCILDLNDSGVLITAIHGRDGTRIYAKNIDHGLSKQELSAEEKKALAEAMKDKTA